MNRIGITKLLQGAVLAGICTGALCAAPITGTFNIAGTIIVTPDAITWQSNDSPFPPNIAKIGPTPTGSFSALGGTTITISDLDRPTEPVGSPFAEQPFIAFNADPSLPKLLINYIYKGIFSNTDCATEPATVGQTCTPGPPDSPFNFTNNPPPAPAGPQATATFVFTGVSDDHLSVWRGNFTSQFDVPYQTVLAAFAPGGSGSVTNTFSATITVQAIPEPGTIALMGFGTLALFGWRRRRSQV